MYNTVCIVRQSSCSNVILKQDNRPTSRLFKGPQYLCEGAAAYLSELLKQKFIFEFECPEGDCLNQVDQWKPHGNQWISPEEEEDKSLPIAIGDVPLSTGEDVFVWRTADTIEKEPRLLVPTDPEEREIQFDTMFDTSEEAKDFLLHNTGMQYAGDTLVLCRQITVPIAVYNVVEYEGADLNAEGMSLQQITASTERKADHNS